MANNPVPVKQTAPTAMTAPDTWRSFRSEMDRLFDRVAGSFGLSTLPLPRFDTGFTIPSPAVDIVEDDASFKFTAELPGLSEKDVEVALSGDTLTIKGEKRQEREEKKQDYHLTERNYGAFQRAFVLPADVDSDKVTAAFTNGILTVTVPKTAKAAAKKIEVKAA